jgi:ferredoxin
MGHPASPPASGNVVFFWSATGNSLCAARAVADRLGAGGEACAVVPMAAADPAAYCLDGAYRRVGFAFPVYWGGVPEPVERFIAGLAVGDSPPAYVFTLVTSGGSGFKSTGHDVAGLLAGRGLTPGAAYSVTFYSSYYVAHSALVYRTRPDRAKATAAAEARLADVAGRVAALEPTPRPRRNPLAHYLYDARRHSLTAVDERFTVTPACNGCTLCARLCPAGNITLDAAGRPVWRHACTGCLGCLHWCPKAAIDFGPVTRGRERYHHPSVNLKRLIQALHPAV